MQRVYCKSGAPALHSLTAASLAIPQWLNNISGDVIIPSFSWRRRLFVLLPPQAGRTQLHTAWGCGYFVKWAEAEKGKLCFPAMIKITRNGCKEEMVCEIARWSLQKTILRLWVGAWLSYTVSGPQGKSFMLAFYYFPLLALLANCYLTFKVKYVTVWKIAFGLSVVTCLVSWCSCLTAQFLFFFFL